MAFTVFLVNRLSYRWCFPSEPSRGGGVADTITMFGISNYWSHASGHFNPLALFFGWPLILEEDVVLLVLAADATRGQCFSLRGWYHQELKTICCRASSSHCLFLAHTTSVFFSFR